MKIRVAIVSMGRSHLIHLAKHLQTKRDVDVVFYTMMPASRCRQFGYYGKVSSFLFPIGLCEIIIRKLPKVSEYKKDAYRLKLREWFDKIVSRCLKKCDIIIGLNGMGPTSSKVAKSKYGSIVICDQGSSHILRQNAVRRSYSNSPISEYGTNYILSHYQEADFLLAPSDYVRNSDIENGIVPDSILSNQYGVDTSLFHKTEKPVDPDETYDVIMVGSWWKHKGCDMLVDACLNKLKVKLLHVGSVVDCKLPNNPLFLHIDAVPESELPNYYSKAKVLVMCSLDAGYGPVLLQAAACGLPIVGSTRTGLNDLKHLLCDNVYCHVIPEPLTSDNIASTLSKAITQANEMPLGIRNIYEDNIKNITWEAYGERYYNIIKDLITNKQSN